MWVCNFVVVALLVLRINSQECGIALPESTKGRIVGGKDVGGFKYPWYVSLQLPFLNHPVCGGALISDKYVVTAAHCFDVAPKEKHNTVYQVVLGVYDQCEETEPTREIFPTKKVNVHEDYQPRGKFFDIALIELERAAKNYMPVCLPQIKTRARSKFGLVMGLGVTKAGGEQPCELQELDVRVYTSRECVKSRLPLTVVREPTVICAGFLEGGKDSCQGDSGGPLQVIGTFKKQWVLRGLVSFGYGCAREGLPGVYTSVSHYIPWLQQKTGIFHNNTLVPS